MTLLGPRFRGHAASGLAAGLLVVLCASWLCTVGAQTNEDGTSELDSYWDKIYELEDSVDPVDVDEASVGEEQAEPIEEDDFLDHLFVRAGVDYRFNFADFSNSATRTFIVDGDVPLSVTPEGFVFPDVYDDDDTQMAVWAVAGTRGYLNPKLNTYFSAQYEDSDVDQGSIFQTFADAFGRGDFSQLINAYAELTELGDDGYLADTSARVGRQYMFDSSPYLLGSALFDGGMARYRADRLELEVFAGRHVNAFSEPDDDFTMGVATNYEFKPNWWAAANWALLQGENAYAFEVRRNADVVSGRSFLTFRDADPIELGADLWYTPGNLPLRVQASVLRRLNSQGFVYDIFLDRDELQRRLRMGTEDASTSFRFEADYDLSDWVTIGGTALVQDNDSDRETAFDNSFYELSGRVFLTPWEKWDFLAQYTYRNIDRGDISDAIAVTAFNDTSTSGENIYKEVSGDIYYRLNEDTSVNAGAFYSVIDARTRLALLRDSDAWGAYFRARTQLNRQLEGKLEYTWDRPNSDYFPELDAQHTLLLGLEYRYH